MSLSVRERVQGRRRIYLVRHGDVRYFDESGQPYSQADVPLTETGQEQCRLLGAELRALPIDRWVSSGMRRTEETFRLLVGERDLEAEVYKGLQEIVPGRLAKLGQVVESSAGRDAVDEGFADAFGGSVHRDAQFLGGERFGDFEDRVQKAFAELVAAPDWKEMLVVAHGGTNRILLLAALGSELGAMNTLEQDPGCLNVLDIDTDGRCVVRLVNYTPADRTKREMHLTTLERIYLENVSR
jgi:broad specificity phosphatase PhoE